ncbi:ribonuclease P protein component [Sulfurovum mangrovi]|uniref:ribonuclease P protein component n=1 Tax=Sulfurovum mangrovi TaxID=2893889 RepID=UPI002989B972|nr:ribonuclease P protein component [Sulfurovum mangrovi]
MSSIKHFTRIKTSKEFSGVYHRSSCSWHTPYFVLFFKKGSTYKAGFVASKKIGNAVQRNRAKRLLRAHFIENIDLLSAGSYVLVAKPAILEADFKKTDKAYLHALKKCAALK